MHADPEAVNPARKGTNVAADDQVEVAPGGSCVIRLRLTDRAPAAAHAPFADFDAVFEQRRSEADAFYAALTPSAMREDIDRCNVLRQTLAGMLRTKQYFYYDLDTWL